MKGRCECPDVGVPPSAAGREAWPKGKKLTGEEETHRRGHQRGDGCVCVCSGRGVQAGECQVITPLKASSDPLGVRSWAKCCI